MTGLGDRLDTAAILTDVDGTLSAIVDDPAAARPVLGALEVLGALADTAPVVGVISGRPVAFLAGHLSDPRLQLAGLYGLERRIDGSPLTAAPLRRTPHPSRTCDAEQRSCWLSVAG